MKKTPYIFFVFFILSHLLTRISAAPLNEWTFVQDPAGQTLSEALNTGTESAQFSSGGSGILETDGNNGLVSTGDAPSDGMWTEGTLLDAAVIHPLSGIQYLRYDFEYDLSDIRNDCGTVIGLSFLDETGSNIAGVFFHDQNSAPAPAGLTETEITGGLALTGSISVIMRLDTSVSKMDIWYDLTGSNSFSEINPSLAEVSVKLTSIDKLRFQATGDFRPEGSDNHATMDNIRTASTWSDITAPPAQPQLSVHPLFQDHMVLQRDMPVPVWGHAAPGASVTIRLDGVEAESVTADLNGRWLMHLAPHAHDGGQSHTLQISAPDERDILIADVLFGEVYLASGQSNMYRQMNQGILDYDAEVAAADYPQIRLLQVELTDALTEQEEPELRTGWMLCSPSTVPNFSATSYFFSRTVHLTTEIPVGILSCAWGGQKIDRFLNPWGVSVVPELSGLQQYQELGGINNLYDIYNAMIAPLVPYGIRGAIWYQGESNGSEADLYRFKMQALTRGWRHAWGQGNFPFYYVQLSTWAYGENAGRDFTGLRSAQTRFLSETNTGMVVTIDIGDEDPTNIHPHNKQDVGARLAQWALSNEFNHDTAYSGPLYHNSIHEGASIRVIFDHADPGLMVGVKVGTNPLEPATGPLENFEIAGADKTFVPAEAVIDADTVVVSNAAVSSPQYVRYCYTAVPGGSNLLYNTAGLPASPFCTDEAYRLDVISGTGSETKQIPGTTQSITADTPAAGSVFDRWIGAASEINDPNASSATITMPDHAMYLLASYRNTGDAAYTLTVNNGYGSGTSQAGSIIIIEAEEPAPNYAFDHWTGDTQHVINVYADATTLRMPADDVTLSATYRIIDSVGDEIPDSWRKSYFGDDAANNSQAQANADPDGDGANNLQEYQAGTNPTSAESVLCIEPLGISADRIQMRFPTQPRHRYRFEAKDTLNQPAWTPVFYNLTGDGSWINIQLEQDGWPSRFYRVTTTVSEHQ